MNPCWTFSRSWRTKLGGLEPGASKLISYVLHSLSVGFQLVVKTILVSGKQKVRNCLGSPLRK